MQKGREIEGLVSPVSQVRVAWSAAHPFPVHEEDELIVSADINKEMVRLPWKVDGLAEVEDRQISLRGASGRYPLSFPEFGLVLQLGVYDAYTRSCECQEKYCESFHRASHLGTRIILHPWEVRIACKSLFERMYNRTHL